MRPYHLSSTSRALYRIFIAPYLISRSIHTLPRPSIRPPKALVLPQIPHRSKSFKRTRPDNNLANHYILDDAIEGPKINLVGAENSFRAFVSLDRVLKTLDRRVNHLVQLTPGNKNLEEDDHESIPTCKIQSKIDLRIHHGKKLDLQREAEKKKKEGASGKPKQLELNWAIEPNDLNTRLKRMKEFLGQGRRVELAVGPKKRGRVATEQECKALLKKIEDAVGEVNGAKEVQREGDSGKSMVLTFEGKKLVGKT